MVNEATAKARRSEALFRSSNAGISRRWLTDKVADLEWECARLRVQLEDATKSNGRLKESCAKLRERIDASHMSRLLTENENESLRELVRDMWQFTGAACKKYPRLFDHFASGGQMVKPNMIDAFEQRMSDLGIEVPE